MYLQKWKLQHGKIRYMEKIHLPSFSRAETTFFKNGNMEKQIHGVRILLSFGESLNFRYQIGKN